uniref:LBH domain-containing protein n=1 Tax=Poecilia mexicana TaxID=48701 RepID=A0A3B3YA98_9TELE
FSSSCSQSKVTQVIFSGKNSQNILIALLPNRDKERLPSIVVEPTEVSEVESGELRWPPENIETEDDEEDLFSSQVSHVQTIHLHICFNVFT